MSIYKILKQVKPSLNKNQIDKNIDLMESGLIDSFEILEFIQILEINYNFSYENYSKKYSNFKVVNFEKFLNVSIF